MRMHTGSIAVIVLGGLLALAMVACGKPQPPDKEQPPEPQAVVS